MTKGKYIRTKEHRKNMRLISKKNWKNPEYREKNKGMLGKKLSEETKRKIRLSLFGNKNAFGYKHTKEAKRKMKLYHRKFNTLEQIEKTKKAWLNPEFRNKTIKNMLKNKKIFPREQKLLNIIEKNNFPFNYVGNGKAVFNGFCPDFLSKNPKHIIELFGDRHYNKESKKRDRKRLKAYSSLGYKTLIINNWELKNEEKVIEKIKEFIK